MTCSSAFFQSSSKPSLREDFEHFAAAPGELFFGDFDEFVGGVGDDLEAEFVAEGGVADGVSEDGVEIGLGDAGEFFAEVSGVGVDGFVEFGEGLGGPAGEVGVVAVIESVPFFEGGGELAGKAGGTVGDGGFDGAFAGGDFFAMAGDLFFEAKEVGGDFGGIRGFDADAVIDEFEDIGGEGEEGEGFSGALAPQHAFEDLEISSGGGQVGASEGEVRGADADSVEEGGEVD